MEEKQRRKRVLLLGAAGRDFHNFNVVYRDDPNSEVVAFTAAQIPGIVGRRYPAALAGPLYPEGIPIEDERDLEKICRERCIDQVMFAYSDVTHEEVMHLASRALACGADFILAGPQATMLRAARPVIAVSAIRTGCGKSQTARHVARLLRARGFQVAVLRHPMPYGDLSRQRVQRFATLADLSAADCTIEEREEYEPHIAAGNVVFAGVDYAAIVAEAEREADVIVWDGGNNDFPFLRPDLHIVIADALRPGQATTHHPGEAVLRMADVIVVNKTNSASSARIEDVSHECRAVNPKAPVLLAASTIRLDDAEAVRGRRVLVVEDGPTITHGGMATGAGFEAALAVDALPVDPREWAAPEIEAVYDRYPHIGQVLPAVGYGKAQLAALERTIESAVVDVVIAATPVDLGKLIKTTKRIVRARYEYADVGRETLTQHVEALIAKQRQLQPTLVRC
jgi:predicted GTPase